MYILSIILLGIITRKFSSRFLVYSPVCFCLLNTSLGGFDQLQSIILIAVFRVCVCVSVYLSVISEISGTGRRSATLLTPFWRASPGKLRRLLLELTGCLVQEKSL